MKILEFRKNKKQYMELLLLADEQEDMIDKYIDRGMMFATNPNFQRMGYGKILIDFVITKYKNQFSTLQVGTGDSPKTIDFYLKCGFSHSHIVKNFFTDNYNHPIYEDGIQLVDMIYLRRDL